MFFFLLLGRKNSILVQEEKGPSCQRTTERHKAMLLMGLAGGQFFRTICLPFLVMFFSPIKYARPGVGKEKPEDDNTHTTSTTFPTRNRIMSQLKADGETLS